MLSCNCGSWIAVWNCACLCNTQHISCWDLAGLSECTIHSAECMPCLLCEAGMEAPAQSSIASCYRCTGLTSGPHSSYMAACQLVRLWALRACACYGVVLCHSITAFDQHDTFAVRHASVSNLYSQTSVSVVKGWVTYSSILVTCCDVFQLCNRVGY
eukprot:GHUV01018686.1.p1 GENE.GHUV01018686.1~~GHUV01018686.1.p1  ORF type:complete len:157 (+),score=11.62 GHUV01018686.1:1977-2447(+)